MAVAVTMAFAATGAQAQQVVPSVDYPGVQKLHYEFGPIAVQPGQNTIEIKPNSLKPPERGFITRFTPNLVYADTKRVPAVDVIHLHHGVWLIRGQPTFAAGEEKTILQLPQGFGMRHRPRDGWLMNYMVHNLTSTSTDVYITYDVDFVPETSPAAATITEAKALWMDVSGIKAYPVFDALKGSGSDGRYTFPDDARGAARAAIGPAQQWTADRDVTLVGTAGHLHPGGLYTDLDATRGGVTKRLFRSEARYFEPAGAVSWDVAMTATKPGWRVAVKSGDRLDLSATYDTRRASWYESMGIDVVWYAEGHTPGAVDPFAAPIDTSGEATHGHLPENDNHGGVRETGLPDARKLLAGYEKRRVDISDFVYGRGHLGLGGIRGRPPVVRAGRSLQFRNLDATATTPVVTAAYHTITACRAPCTKATGIAYPLADARVQFDSGELGYGPANFTAAANRNTWSTPKTLKPGTYTYFCRIHPSMRGAFRVVKAKRRRR